MTPSVIEPVTLQFVAQYLNHCATAVLPTNVVMNIIVASSLTMGIVELETC